MEMGVVALPRKLLPTVNADNDNKTENMLKHFLPFMDLSSDKKRLDAYFSTPRSLKVARVDTTTISPAQPASTDGEVDTTASQGALQQQTTEIIEEVVDLQAVDIEEQQRIWAQIRIRMDSSTLSTAISINDEPACRQLQEPSPQSISPCSHNAPKRQSSLKAYFGGQQMNS